MTAPEHEALRRRADAEADMCAKMTARMVTKMDYSREVKRRGGWQSPRECPITELHDLLYSHVSKHNLDMVDVCNLAAMIDWRVSHYPAERAQLQAHIATKRQHAASDDAELFTERDTLEKDARLSMAGLDDPSVTLQPDLKHLHIERVVAVLNLSKGLEAVIAARGRVKACRARLSEVAARLKAHG